ncbi:hypothetical protein HNP38_000587 [Chryseobacterium defluvii]|uniref:C1q domain-containing protein n=1 Tax=Chryseobacterium defluvii TaxID=160396 RepID=A0A840KA61_9FLAO|nr:hypothetical protein [Chryseobacterium defluvii]MBB4805315.1 hypothetical protein [Chryseobacterium defluvii]
MKNKCQGIYTMLMISALYYSTGFAYAQTGIGTRNPKAALHIDGAKDNDATAPAAPTTAQLANDVVVTNAGFVGVGVLAPTVKLDMRSSGTENALGLDTTTMTASAAAAGAVRYDVTNIPTGAKLQVSDGAVWNKIYVAPQKAVVVARKISGQSIAPNTATNIINWYEVRDMSNSFDFNSGEFLVPRNGTYTFLLTFNFNGTTIIDGSRVESQFYNVGTSTVLASVYKTFGQSMTGVSDDANQTRSTQAGGSSTVTLTLTAGTRVVVRLFHTLISSGTLSLRVTSNSLDPANPNDGFNNLTIIEH